MADFKKIRFIAALEAVADKLEKEMDNDEESREAVMACESIEELVDILMAGGFRQPESYEFILSAIVAGDEARCQNCGTPWKQNAARSNAHGCKDDNGGNKTRCPKCGWCSCCSEGRL